MEIDGGCHCGEIRYKAVVNSDNVVICHCTDCQTLSGGAFRTAVPAAEGTFVLLRGVPKRYVKVAESGNRRELGFCWRGKIFFPSNNKRVSKGKNRIKESLLVPSSPIVPQAKFDTMLLDSHPLAKGAASNVVILSYTDPQTRPYWAELVATTIQGYDIQVAVKGQYGPLYIGKTWFGKYDQQGEFIASDPDKSVAFYSISTREHSKNNVKNIGMVPRKKP